MVRHSRFGPLPTALARWVWAGLAVLLWLLWSPACAEPARAPLELGSQTSAQAVWQALRLRTGLPDDASLATLPDDPAGWRASPATFGNLGPQRQPVALQLEWVVAPGGGGAWMLEIDYPSLDHIELELKGPDGQVQTWTVGDHHRFSERPLASRAFAVPLVLQEGQRYQITGVVRTTGSMILPIRLERPEVFWLHESREQLLQGGLCGALLCLLVYVLSQGRALRDEAHLWYSLNVLGTVLFFFSYQGLGVQHLWGEVDWASRKMTMLAGLLGLGSAFMYVDSVLELRQRAPWLSLCMRGLAAVLLVTLGLFALGLVSYRGAHLVNVLLSPAPLLMALPTAWRLARAGDRVARFLLVGWAVFGGCAMCFTLLQRGLLPVGFWTGHAFQFGTLVELMTWMMMLATRTQASKVAGEMAVRERDLLATIAHTDALTGLLNRRGLQAAAEPLLARCETGGASAVFLIDLDRFKPINDQHGHDAGDAVLRGLGQRLKASLRSQDVVARLGGDEFVVVAGPLSNEADAGAVASKLMHAVSRPFDVNGLSLELGMTVGYALAPQDSTSLPELLKRADAAMYSAKLAGRGGVQRSAAGVLAPELPPQPVPVP